MNRFELVAAVAVILLIAFALGWFACWFVNRLSRVSTADIGKFEAMSEALREAEETRDNALVFLERRESELTSQLNQTEAELAAAMEGLRSARKEADDLRVYYAGQNVPNP